MTAVKALRRSPFVFVCMLLVLGLCAGPGAEDTRAQTPVQSATPTQSPQQAPRTAPQVQATLPSYEGQNVTSVEIAGQPNLSTTDLLPLLAQRAGQPFSQAKVDQSVKALQNTGRFHAVELEIRPDPNGVRVLMVLQPAVYFGVFEFPGAADKFAYSRLLQIADYPPRGPYTPVDVRNAQMALERFFKRSGYFLAQVKPEIRTDAAHGIANVYFHTTLNKRAKFGDVDIEGPTPQETAHLKSKLHSFMARLKSSSIRRGKPYNVKTLQNASTYLENTLMKEDRLGGTVQLIGASYDPATNHADIKFHVEPGPLVHVKVEGAHLWSWTKHKLLPVYQMNGLDPELIQEGKTNLTSYFQSKGFFDAKVTTQVQPQGQGSETIVYDISKGPRHKVDDVKVAGNDHISEKDLMSHVTVEQGHWFSHGKYSEKLVRASANNLKRVYQADGFSSVKVTPQVTNKNGNIDVVFRVDEGPRDVVAAMKIEGNDTMSVAQMAPKGLHLSEGSAYSTKLVDDDRNQIIANYLKMGYLNASFRETAQTIGGDKHKLAVTYHITEGPRVQTATVVMLGQKETKLSLINRTADIKGGPLREDEMMASESRLYTLGVFDWAEVDPRRTITTQTQEDVLVKVHEAKKNDLTYGFGFEVINRGGSLPSGTVVVPGVPPVGLPAAFKTSEKTFWGPRGSFQYTRKDFRGKAETLSVGALAGRLDQKVDFTWSDPHFRLTDWSANLTASGENDLQNPIFSSRLAQGGLQFQHALNEDKTQNIFLRYNLKETGLTHLLLPDLIPAEDRHVRLSTLSSTYIRDTRDNILDATKGIYETAEFDLNPSALGSNVNFAKLLAQTAYYHDIFKGIVWANSVRVGLEQAFAGSHVPISERFFSGGGSTLRGFPLNGAGPQHSIRACGNPSATCNTFINVPVGGNELFILNSEFRIPINYDLPFVHKNLGFVTFYDGGNVYDTVGFHNFWTRYSNTVGFGLRYKTPVGPVRIDIGHNLNPLPGIKSTQLFITLGQAF